MIEKKKITFSKFYQAAGRALFFFSKWKFKNLNFLHESLKQNNYLRTNKYTAPFFKDIIIITVIIIIMSSILF